MHLVIALLITAIATMGQENTLVEGLQLERPQQAVDRDLRLWKLSAAALVGASALDVASSWGKCCERNTLLASADRRFGARGLAIKSATVGGQLLLQYWIARKNARMARVLGFVNFVGAGAVTAVAIRNYGVPQAP